MNAHIINTHILIYLLAFGAQYLIAEHTYNVISTSDELVVALVLNQVNSNIAVVLEPFIKEKISSFVIFYTSPEQMTERQLDKKHSIFFDQKQIVCKWIMFDSKHIDLKSNIINYQYAQKKIKKHFPLAHFMLIIDSSFIAYNISALLEFYAKRKNTEYKAYFICIKNGIYSYYQPLLLTCSQAISEDYYAFIKNIEEQKVPSFFFEILNYKRSQSLDMQKLLHKKDILLEQCTETPADPGSAFELAQVYSRLGDWANACKFLKYRTCFKVWPEEDFMAHYLLAQTLEQWASTNNAINWSEILACYIQAFSLRPHRAEPLIKIAQYYLEHAQFAPAFLFSYYASELQYPQQELLALEQKMYMLDRYMILAESAWHMQQFSIGHKALRKAMETYPEMPYLHQLFNSYQNQLLSIK